MDIKIYKELFSSWKWYKMPERSFHIGRPMLNGPLKIVIIMTMLNLKLLCKTDNHGTNFHQNNAILWKNEADADMSIDTKLKKPGNLHLQRIWIVCKAYYFSIMPLADCPPSVQN